MNCRMNVIAVFSPDKAKLLFCHRRKAPYAGKLNFVGGKIEPGEDSAHAAYRELEEETGLTRADITLYHVVDMDYFGWDIHLEAWFGVMNAPKPLREEKNPLCWLSADADVSDLSRFAGDGSIAFILGCIREWQAEQQG